MDVSEQCQGHSQTTEASADEHVVTRVGMSDGRRSTVTSKRASIITPEPAPK